MTKFSRATSFGFFLCIALAGCASIERGMAGTIHEKMSIFSLIVLIVLALICVPLVKGTWENRPLARHLELVRNAAIIPVQTEVLTNHPVYVWDSRSSFYKMLFAADGSLAISSIITTNGVDPATKPAGSWGITPDGIVQLSLTATTRTRAYTCITRNGYNIPSLIRLASGHAEAWFLGEQGLALAQISCFGYAKSAPAEKFDARMVGGKTVYWATYPCIIPISNDEICVNPELAYGSITFHADGTVSKSLGRSYDAPPDYAPAFSGTWRIDEKFGVLFVTIGYDTTQVNLLLRSAQAQSLLIGTALGTEQWFMDQQNGRQDLASYLALGVHLDPAKCTLFS